MASRLAGDQLLTLTLTTDPDPDPDPDPNPNLNLIRLLADFEERHVRIEEDNQQRSKPEAGGKPAKARKVKGSAFLRD